MNTHEALTRRRFLAGAAAGLGLGLAGEGTAAPKKKQAGPAAPWKAGMATAWITPDKPQWMGGYGSRNMPSTGVIQDLYVKALALEDAAGGRAVLVTADIIGFPASLAGQIAERVEERYGLARERLLLNASHTHSGPVLAHPYQITYKALMSATQWRDVERYSTALVEKAAGVAGAALADLRPARLGFGHGAAEFAMNRRQKTGKGYTIGVNPEGPVDRDVPILRVDSPEGALRAVVFGYACHNTTLTGGNYRLCGDYAGFAKAALERRHPDASAFFVTGCGADANPQPRGTLELARQHGAELAAAVEKGLSGPLAPVRGPLRAAFEVFPIGYAPAPTREALQEGLKAKNDVDRRHAEELLKILKRDGRLPADYPYTLQVWQFGSDLTLVALAGEVVVDYALRLKKEFGPERIWVAGYNNDVFGYVPSLRVLREGGYEAGGAMAGTRHTGPFAEPIEETIVGKVHELVDRVRGPK